MSLDVNKVRMQDIRNLFRYYTATPLGRLVTLQFLLTNWDEINARLATDNLLGISVRYDTESLIYETKVKIEANQPISLLTNSFMNTFNRTLLYGLTARLS